MHCWRHKTPIIYRATNQWFAAMDRLPQGNETLRETALRALEATKFFPEWGKARLHGMIASRPDWTLSRQRNWGVPMALFVHRETGDLHPRTLELLEAVAQKVEQAGVEAWQSITTEEMLGSDAPAYEKVNDILDVWFDSGSTFDTVIGGPEGEASGLGSHGRSLKYPADLYLEGSDQHRGWFHSSLLISCMLYGRAPYDALLTHGFFVDGEGRKMSKSLGNIVAPQKISDSLGADILRLWVGSTDYSGELSISKEILNRVVEAYRRIRNTLRFLLANTADFDPARDAVSPHEMVEVDRYAIALAATWQDELVAHYAAYEFHLVAQKLQTFCSEDLGGFYLDILKDRLYTAAKDSPARRSAQTALHHITQSVLRLMAPILSFTAEEAWALAVGRAGDSVFMHQWHVFPAVDEPAQLLGEWDALRAFRSDVLKQLEALRIAGAIGSSLQANVDVYACGESYRRLARLDDDLRFVLITSHATVHEVDDVSTERVLVAASEDPKCERCWHYRADVGIDAAHPALCGRCVSNLFGAGESRQFA